MHFSVLCGFVFLTLCVSLINAKKKKVIPDDLEYQCKDMVEKTGCEKLKRKIFNAGNEEALKKWGKLSNICCSRHQFLMEQEEHGFCGEGFCSELKKNKKASKVAMKEEEEENKATKKSAKKQVKTVEKYEKDD